MNAPFDPILIGSIIIMQIGAKHLDFELTDFQKKLLKNNIVQFLIFFCIVYMPIRDFFKTFIIVCISYLLIYVFFNEKHKYNMFSKKLLQAEGIIKEYNNIKNKYYDNIKKINIY